MADLSKLARRRLGPPPPIDDASTNLQAPEVAPAAPLAPAAAAPVVEDDKPRRKDGRSLRRTGRTVQFATRISPQLDQDIRDIAESRQWLITEVLEKAVATLKKNLAAR